MVYKYGGVTYYLRAISNEATFRTRRRSLVPFYKILNSKLQGWSRFSIAPMNRKKLHSQRIPTTNYKICYV